MAVTEKRCPRCTETKPPRYRLTVAQYDALQCVRGLGKFANDARRLRAAADYLERCHRG